MGACFASSVSLTKAMTPYQPVYIQMISPKKAQQFVERSHQTRQMVEANAANETSADSALLANSPSLLGVTSFLDAVQDGDSAAGE